jgi:hypothetical protein
MKKISQIPVTFPCKAEELVAIASFILVSLKRDAKAFEDFSHFFGKKFISDFEAQVKSARNLLKSGAKGAASLKLATEALYATLDAIILMNGQIKVFIKRARPPLNLKSFGLSAINEKARKRDAEGVIGGLELLADAVSRNEEALKKAGLPPKTIAMVKSAGEKVARENQKQYEMKLKRSEETAKNNEALNSLYVEIMSICDTGKLIFRKSKPARIKEYTFIELKKKVRSIQSAKPGKPDSGDDKPGGGDAGNS